MREYFLQRARTPNDLVARRRTVDSISQSQVLVLDSPLRLLWISDEYCRASHELPPHLESLHLSKSLCSLRALWS